MLNGVYLLCTGAYSHHCYGAVHQAGKNLLSHFVKQKSEKFSVFKHTLLPISKECAHWELNPQAPSFLQEPFQLRRTGTFNFYILALSLTPTATAVPWLSPGCITDVFTPLRSVWESLRWVLPGQRPLLRLGRCWVLEILSYCQEVGAGNR